MIERLFVVLGAGASADAASPDLVKGLRPPLVTQLFDPHYDGVLDRYPIAQMAAADIRPQTSTSFSIERFIREQYHESSHWLDKRKYLALPPYFQDLLFQVSQSYARSPDNYDRLLSALLKLPDVVFITLNYDTLLDDRLDALSPIRTLGDYLGGGERNWSLIKLHGSVNWGRRVREPDDLDLLCPQVAAVALGDIELYRSRDLNSIRQHVSDPFGLGLFYPALSVPVGEDDELVCPHDHVEFVRQKLNESQPIHLLVIGYSAADREVLKLISESQSGVGSLAVVNYKPEATDQARRKLLTDLGVDHRFLKYDRCFDRGFGAFTLDGLADYMEWAQSEPF